MSTNLSTGSPSSWLMARTVFKFLKSDNKKIPINYLNKQRRKGFICGNEGEILIIVDIWQIHKIMAQNKEGFFMIPADILGRSLANFQRTNTWNFNLSNRSTSESGQFVIVKEKLASGFYASVLLLTMNCHNIVKGRCVSTRLSSRGSAAILTMLWRNSWSLAEQMNEIKELFY